jgi:hypothetical protein
METEAYSPKPGCAAHPASYSTSTGGYFPNNKADSFPSNYNQHDNEVKSELHLAHKSPCLVTKGRYILKRTDFGRSQFTDDDRDGTRNIGLFAIQSSYEAASPRTFN